MTTLLLERTPAFEKDIEHDTRHGLDGARLPGRADAHGRLTLDDLITGVWEGLAVHGAVACPVCESPMTSGLPAGGHEAPTGTCLNCGSRLF